MNDSYIPAGVLLESISTTDQVLYPLLVQAGHQALTRFRRVAASSKSDGSPVTEADIAAEQVLVDGLHQAFPTDAIISEEGATQPGTDGTWVVDPLDGTSSYVEGLAHWGPVVARIEDGVVTCGASYLPRLSDYFFVEHDVGAFLNRQRLSSIADRPVKSSDVLYVPSGFHRVATLHWPGKTRCLGSNAAHLALVAAGAAVATLIPGDWDVWDTACGLALIHQVGGAVVGAAGTPLVLRDLLHNPSRPPLVAGTPSAVNRIITEGAIQLRPPLPTRETPIDSDPHG